MSWNLYDSAARPIDALSDAQLAPDPGGSNLPTGRRVRREGRLHRVHRVRAAARRNPAPNTLYTGDSRGGTFLYRVYVPDRGQDAKGGVPLPKVTLEPAGGAGGAPGARRVP